jgi:hypothetical protein
MRMHIKRVVDAEAVAIVTLVVASVAGLAIFLTYKAVQLLF